MARPKAARTTERHLPGTLTPHGTGIIVFSELMQVDTVGHEYRGEVLIVKLTQEFNGDKYALECISDNDTTQMYDGCTCLRFRSLAEAAAYLEV